MISSFQIGICGRTGSGKSSLTLGLFRLIDICEGEILVDGVDVSRVRLDTLRSSLAVVPQDPVLFTGTIRYHPPEKSVENLFQATRRTAGTALWSHDRVIIVVAVRHLGSRSLQAGPLPLWAGSPPQALFPARPPFSLLPTLDLT